MRKHWTFRSPLIDCMSPSTWPLIMGEFQWLL